ncbi:MAG: 50S ribosomal protein L33 [Candidatus Jacksonbacteria bacterium RIFOXYC2_FULL_44_29]|nr:MAG: 50S ribosomal protein L33 [Candidatus Jacksonbacteria bacterium RIFOXYA2_FULL_43_12]OGY76314.1 MAG: 50S ribosomal protein L33 [Candidatus Jacksonbacteria bacterium RIFOXYB2_FULL_44_15]OGY78141.1 MAG: 50S ribosomal protein L33 [Candidatus Jacksonbacteria bacterium RIFOXYC2_FULL_44_29]OGY80951.1 MAG: 50S ribosomal protein L33 [Candidatus Jacksonbacteria bacterium RIFOXYD2_FULL_43_21]HBH46724.1 50S ribosomal protein L33 [Candidatus Jacksonbacteria bacterium]
MAKKAKEKLVWLECSVCQNKNYTTFNSLKKEKKLELNKFCMHCRKHTPHKQAK